MEKHERFFGFVKAVGDKREDVMADMAASSYETKTMGTRHVQAARAAGEGVRLMPEVEAVLC